MLSYVLIVTGPVFIGALISGLIGAAKGARVLWASLIFVALLTSAVYVVVYPQNHLGYAQQFLIAIFGCLPPLALAGVLYQIIGRRRWVVRWSLPLAAGVAAANLLLSPFFFVLGCAGRLWVCP